MTFAQLGAALEERWPGRDPMALSQTVRARLSVVQIPPRGVWGASGQAKHTTIETWLGRDVSLTADVDAVVLRYLAAFGPATVADAQMWSGLTRLRRGLRPPRAAPGDVHGRRRQSAVRSAGRAPAESGHAGARPAVVRLRQSAAVARGAARRVITDGYRGQVFSTDMTQPSLCCSTGSPVRFGASPRGRGAAATLDSGRARRAPLGRRPGGAHHRGLVVARLPRSRRDARHRVQSAGPLAVAADRLSVSRTGRRD